MRIFLLLVVLHCCSGMADASATPGTSDATSSAAFEASAEGASMDTELDIKDIIPSRPHKAWITAKIWRRSKGQCTVHIQWTAGANQRRLSVNVKSADNKKALKGTDDFLASNTTEVKRHLASTFERMQDEDKIPKSLRLMLLASEEELHSR